MSHRADSIESGRTRDNFAWIEAGNVPHRLGGAELVRTGDAWIHRVLGVATIAMVGRPVVVAHERSSQCDN